MVRAAADCIRAPQRNLLLSAGDHETSPHRLEPIERTSALQPREKDLGPGQIRKIGSSYVLPLIASEFPPMTAPATRGVHPDRRVESRAADVRRLTSRRSYERT
jgi:hypothetical protein